ncbi:2-(hydroxymethyl)glutarate dehydrogenase [Serratia quinivorans]|nr:2-(hydroxymethyl)glutarate dehydrogenase [Serratia quinivorans]
MKVGIVGMGKMGLAMAERMVNQGHVVVGWDVNTAVSEQAKSIGALFANTPVELVDLSEVIISIVTDDAAVEWLFTSKNGLLDGAAAGKLFIEMSTLQPATIRRIGKFVEHANARLVGAPVLGSIPTAKEGQLLVLAGGHSEDIERSKTVLQAVARDVLNLGPLGSGNAMKLVVNLTMAAYVEALAEGLALGCQQGLQLDSMLRILSEAPTSNPWLHSKLSVLKGETGSLTLDIAALHKDVLSAIATGSSDGISMPLAAGVLSSLSVAKAAGVDHQDIGQFPHIFRQHMIRSSKKSATPANNDILE